jgi:uncharacterized protein YbbC (DUF1343 family)
MDGWRRNYFFKDCGLPWINPSPNLSTMESAISFVGTVVFEGTNISEGRGTTRALEFLGHPKIEAFSFAEECNHILKNCGLYGEDGGMILRPQVFFPMFQKHQGVPCGGVQIHTLNPQKALPWSVGQLLLKEFYHRLPGHFQWNDKPYEYETSRLAVDLINGSHAMKKWVMNPKSTFEELNAIGSTGHKEFLEIKKSIELYL